MPRSTFDGQARTVRRPICTTQAMHKVYLRDFPHAMRAKDPKDAHQSLAGTVNMALLGCVPLKTKNGRLRVNFRSKLTTNK